MSWGRGNNSRISTADIPGDVLDLVTERMGGRFCGDCGPDVVLPADEPLEIDHLQPLSKGGDNHHLNLAWCCRSHNRGRGNRREAPKVPAWRRRRR